MQSTLNGSTSNLPDSTGRPFATSFSAQSATAPGFHHSGAIFPLQSSFSNVPLLNIIKMSVQAVCKDCIISMEASMFQIFHLPLHRGMQHLVVSHQVEFNNLGEAFQVDDLHQTIFQLPCLRFATPCK